MQPNPVRDLLIWYQEMARDLPWRHTRDPYAIWLSEVILQQTRIDQGMAYYHRFLKAFPTVFDLAAAETDVLMKQWEGLGYYSRARNLHATAKVIADELQGQFPQSWDQLIQLKGIGPYTARAIGSFAFDNPVGVLDGNVFRVLSRYLADASPIDLPATRKSHQALLDHWIEEAEKERAEPVSSAFNQAMMDLGATICKPKNWECGLCPLQHNCQALARGLVAELPQKSKKLKRKTVFQLFYLAGLENGELYVRRRPATGLWPNLWELPNIEIAEEAWHVVGDEEAGAKSFKHVFTHIDMWIKVVQVSPSELPLEHGAEPLSLEEIERYAFSRAVLKIFERYLGGNSYFPE